MGKPTGFMEIARQTSTELPPEERIQNFNEFHIPLPQDEQQAQGARCMDCGVPFCQAGMMIGGMASGCPLNNLIPEWNDFASVSLRHRQLLAEVCRQYILHQLIFLLPGRRIGCGSACFLRRFDQL